MLIDEQMPTWERRVLAARVVAAPVGATFAAIRRVDFLQSPVIALPNRARAGFDRLVRPSGQARPEPSRFGFDQLLEPDGGFHLLAEDPGLRAGAGLHRAVVGTRLRSGRVGTGGPPGLPAPGVCRGDMGVLGSPVRGGGVRPGHRHPGARHRRRGPPQVQDVLGRGRPLRHRDGQAGAAPGRPGGAAGNRSPAAPPGRPLHWAREPPLSRRRPASRGRAARGLAGAVLHGPHRRGSRDWTRSGSATTCCTTCPEASPVDRGRSGPPWPRSPP